MKILYKFASRSRPDKFMRCLENIYAFSSSDNYEILCSLDEDDPTMQELMPFHNTTYIYGLSNSKVHAINRDMDKSGEWDILVVMSDDMLFQSYGFDERIRNDFLLHFPDMDGVLHYNDGNQKDNVMTMSIMTRKYYDRFGYVYHPDYKSLYCDEEATEVAKLLGRYKYMGDDCVIFRHFHPAWGLSKYDKQYQKTESREMWDHDEKVFNKRKSKGYEITDINSNAV